MENFIPILLFSLLIDGIKIFIESLASYKKKKFTSDHSLVSVVIPLYNKEKEIGNLLKCLAKLFPKENIFIADDGSTDKGPEIAVREMPEANFFSFKHQGKVGAIGNILQYVSTPFVLLLDADTLLGEDFRCPISLINDSVTAIAFDVMPAGDSEESLLCGFQSYEYAKSMQIGKKFQDRTASVHCISGAAGLFKTGRLKELTKRHSKEWTGEDLERTLIELASDGKVLFVDQLVKTETPKNLPQLIKQRVIGWWPGLWRNIPLFFKIGLKKKVPLQLRIEAGYQLLSLFSDPLKLISLILALVKGLWFALGALYSIYFLLELFVYLRMRNIGLKKPLMVIGFYFFYNLLQMILRLGGLMVFVKKYLIAKKAVIRFLVVFAALMPAIAKADGKQPKNFILSLNYQEILDTRPSGERTINGMNFYLGYKKFYLDADIAEMALQRINLGAYVKYRDVIFTPNLKIMENDTAPKITVEKLLVSPIVGRISAAYSFNKDIADFPTLGGGIDYYWGDYNYASFDIVKELGRENAATFIIKNFFQFKKGIYLRTGVTVNNFSDKGCFAVLGFSLIEAGYSYFENFDYSNFNRQYLTLGFKINF